MADILLDQQSPPAAPAAGKGILYFDSVTQRLTHEDPTGKILTAPNLYSFNTSDVVANAADTYLAGSSITIPPQKLQIGSYFFWKLVATKTAAGVAAPIASVRFGTLGTTGDAALLAFTGPAQTGVVDTAIIEIWAIVRSIGAAGVLAGIYQLEHNLAATGFATQQSSIIQATSAGFNTTIANSIIGISINPGALGVWTFQLVSIEAMGL